jgi:hypothetical protein
MVAVFGHIWVCDSKILGSVSDKFKMVSVECIVEIEGEERR